MHHILREILCAFGDLMHLEESTHHDSYCLTPQQSMKCCSGLPPEEAPVMIAEKRKLFFSFLFNELLLHVAHTRDTVSSPDLMSCELSDLTCCKSMPVSLAHILFQVHC